MSDKSTAEGATPRPAADIDLPKSAIRDLTEKAGGPDEGGTTSAAQPSAEAPKPEPAAPATEPSRPAPQAAKPASSLPVVGGAVAGAIFGLLGAVGYQNLAAPPVTVADPVVHKLREDTSAIHRKLSDDMSAVSAKAIEAKETEQRVTQAFEQKLAALAAQQAKDLEARGMALAKDIEARTTLLDQKAAAAEQRAAVAEQKGAALERLIAAMDQKAATLIAPVDDRLKAAEARLNEGRDQATQMAKRIDLLAMIEPPRVDLRPIVTKIDELERSIGSNAARSTLTGDVAQVLDGRIKAVEQASGSVGQSVKSVEQALKVVDQSLADLKSRPASVDVPAALLAVTGVVRRAMDNGETLGPLMPALAALGVEAKLSAPLAVFADKPVPTPAALSLLFDSLVPAAQPPVPATASAPAAAPSLADRLKSGLLAQVEVKKVGEAVAPALPALSARVKAAVATGDVAKALMALDEVPQDQRAAFKPFVEALSARAAAYTGLKAIEQAALAAVARKG